MRPLLLALAAYLVLPSAPADAAPHARPRPAPAGRIAVAPAAFRLAGPDAAQQLVVTETGSEAQRDRTAEARFASLDPGVAAVSPQGLVTPVADGTARIRARLGGRVTDALVSVRGARGPRPFSFTHDIEPVLTRAGCNSGTCHGKAEGQGGLRLSLFGYDPEADHRALVVTGGRRVARTDPNRSLMLLKPAGGVPHGGGLRLRPDSREYRRLAEWIAAGAPFGAPGEPSLTGVSVFPPERQSGARAEHRLLVTARFSDGSSRDVTREARFASNDHQIATVDETGRVATLEAPGEAAIMAAYGGLVAVSRILVPRPAEKGTFPAPPENNFIDRLVWNRLRKLRIRPSGPAADGEFLRRATLDVLGILPTPEEARAFLDDPDPGKRARLVDRLLDRPEYADLWALKWADILRVNKDRLGAKGAHAFYRWIRDAVAGNMPYDRFVREIVAARGSSAENGAVNYYRVLTKPDELAASVSQVFLGVRIECAQCHHHPFEKWSQDDYYGMVGYFTRLRTKGAGPHSVVLTAGGAGEAVHPRTGKPVPPHPLEGKPAETEAGDRRDLLADWMTRPDNRFVPRMLANRLWAHFLGRGLVEPVDDFRDTNPPSNPELLDALARHLVEGGFDVKRLIRAIMNSRVYQLSSRSHPGNAGDEQNFSRAYPKRLPAEVLMDAIAGAAGVPAHLPGLPPGTRAVQVWDTEWSTQWQSYFLNVFGRPPRTSPCECERSQEPTIAQVLHLVNAPEIQRQISSPEGRARRVAAGTRAPDAILEELFLAAYARRPTPAEAAEGRKLFERAGADRDRAAEDVLWALMNTMEFVFNH